MTSSTSSERQIISVLLVDDQRFVGMAVSRLLAGESDIALHCCYTASDAVAEANRVQPALIVQDLQTAATPIVVLSGNDDAASRGAALAAGAADYLVKLPAKDALVACIRRLGGTPPEIAAPAAPGEAAGQMPALDATLLDALRDDAAPNGGEFLAQLLIGFADEASMLVGRLGDAARRHDVAALKMSAHSLKGASLTVGARRLAGLAGQVEDGADRAPGTAVDASLLASIQDELSSVRARCLIETRAARPASVCSDRKSGTLPPIRL
jgi:CheY-like chemotaxis protein/HPt (histidine-containing phosphotransfer) domain-containing protein